MPGLGNSQFRESAIIHNVEPEPLDDRAELTTAREWVLLVCLGLAMAVIIVWSIFGGVERTFRADGVLVLAGERHVALSSATGTVSDILISAGQGVAAGQAIARVSPGEAESWVRSMALSVRLLEEEATGVTGDGRAGMQRLLASTRALRAELDARQQVNDVESPVDGVIAAMFVAPGQSVPAGAPVADIVAGDADRRTAVAFVETKDSWLLAPGMTARVTIAWVGGSRSIPGELTAVSAQSTTPPAWLPRLHPDVTLRERGHLLQVAIDAFPGFSASPAGVSARDLPDGIPCRIEIVLERTSPLSLLIRS